MNILTDYPDIIKEALIPMIIGIFAIALPLLLQTISRIDDKYSTTKLIKAFVKEPACIIYIASLILSIISYLFWIFQMPRCVDLGCLNQLIDITSLLFVLISTIILIIMTFFAIYLTYIYYIPEKLLLHLIKKHNKSTKNKTFYFESISKILFYSIQKADETLARKLLDFYFDAFINFRKGKEETVIEYPQEFYDSIFEANELLCMRTRRTVSFFNDSTFFELFLDGFQHTILSSKTYRFIWNCLLQALHYDRSDFVYAYWKKAHQQCNFFLRPVEKEYDEKFQVLNMAAIHKREKEREIFIEFHYALGGLLMHLEKYDLINKITNWTNQQPPKYILVPETMEEVIKRYMRISNEGGYVNPVYYEQKYPFPDISGVNSEYIIQMWIKRYLSILFLRQYTLHNYYTYSDSLRMPTPPTKLIDMKRWNEELDSLIRNVDYYLSEKDVLNKIGLADLGKDNWFEENKKEKPSVLIEKLKTQINTTIEKTKQEQEIDPGKLNEFKTSTRKLLKQAFKDYDELFDLNKIDINYKSFYIGGRYQLMDKAAFAKDQEMAYFNSDSIVAEMVSLEFKQLALNAFILMKNLKYQLQDADIFPAINNLNLDSNNYIIVAIGINLEYFSRLNVNGLVKKGDEWFFNQIKIIYVQNFMNDLVSQSLFLIDKEDLPSVIHNQVSEDKIKKFRLARIDRDENIYVQIIDLNKSLYKSIRKEITKSSGQEDLSRSVLVCVDINIEIRYKLNAKCIQLKVFSQFDDRGTVNKISDVRSIW